MKRILFLTACFMSSSFIQCSADLNNAVGELDLERVVQILDADTEKLTEPEITRLVTEVSAKIDGAKQKQTNRALFIWGGGLLAGLLVAHNFIDRPARQEGISAKYMASLLAGIFGAGILTTFFSNSFPYKRAQAIIHLLAGKLSKEARDALYNARLIPVPEGDIKNHYIYVDRPCLRSHSDRRSY